MSETGNTVRLRKRFEHRLAIFRDRGLSVSPDAVILDYGCGAGETVSALVDAGYSNTLGFDIVDYLVPTADRSRFKFSANGKLPYPDNYFDCVISHTVLEHVQDQALAWRELARVMKPGAVSFHAFPPRWRIVEQHMLIPFGSMIGSESYFYFWAALGIRNRFQKGMSARVVAEHNVIFFRTQINYISTAQLKRHWADAGVEGSFCEAEYFARSPRRLFQYLAPVIRRMPLARVALRETWAKNVVVVKPNS